MLSEKQNEFRIYKSISSVFIVLSLYYTIKHPNDWLFNPFTYIKKERGCLTSARPNFEVYHNLIQKTEQNASTCGEYDKHSRIVCIRAQHALCTQRNASK